MHGAAVLVACQQRNLDLRYTLSSSAASVRPSAYTALLTRAPLDCSKVKQQKGETPPEGGDVAGDKYISPVFSFDEEEHRELISAANNVDLVLKGERGHDVRIPFLVIGRTAVLTGACCAATESYLLAMTACRRHAQRHMQECMLALACHCAPSAVVPRISHT
jgi:hypothetical protein